MRLNRGENGKRFFDNRGDKGKNILYMVTATCQILHCWCNYGVVGFCNSGQNDGAKDPENTLSSGYSMTYLNQKKKKSVYKYVLFQFAL